MIVQDSVVAFPTNVEYDDMFECFAAREELSHAVGGEKGYFPNGSQAVCIPLDKIEL